MLYEGLEEIQRSDKGEGRDKWREKGMKWEEGEGAGAY